MRLIPIEIVREGTKIAKTIYDYNGNILLKKGVELTRTIINKMKSVDIMSVYIEDEYSMGEIEDVIKPEVRQKSITYLREVLSNIERINDDSMVIGSNRKKIIEKKNREYFSSIQKIAEEIVDDITSNNNVLLGLVDIKSIDNYVYQHSVNVAVIALSIGISMKFSKKDLLDLALGALVHDIGKAFVSRDIINKEGALTEEENKEFNQHPRKGYEYIKDNGILNSQSTLIVLQHHERMDGLGFPQGLKGDEISDLAKIVSIADCYDYLTSDTRHSRAITAGEALEFIMAHVNTLFDYKYVKVFSKILIAYPKGSIVKLSNGDIAIIESTPANYPLRPLVKIIKSESKERIGKRISLLNELSIVISNVEYNV